jgi:hypothetical protein
MSGPFLLNSVGGSDKSTVADTVAAAMRSCVMQRSIEKQQTASYAFHELQSLKRSVMFVIVCRPRPTVAEIVNVTQRT